MRTESGQAASLESIRAGVDSLRAHQDEIARRIPSHIPGAVPDPSATGHLTYQAGLLAAVNAVLSMASDFERENASELSRNSDDRRALVHRLLVGATADASRLEYRLDGCWHTCMIAVGGAAERTVAAVASALDSLLLSIPQSETHVWAWLGGARRTTPRDIENVPLDFTRGGLTLAISEPRRDRDGWRLAYRQAQAALRVALIEQRECVQYADVALLAPFLVDIDMARSFIHIYLEPLNGMRDGGAIARETLRAYFAAGGLYKVAACGLGLHRHTVRRRIAAIERKLGYPPLSRHIEIGLALRLEASIENWPARTMVELASEFDMAPS